MRLLGWVLVVYGLVTITATLVTWDSDWPIGFVCLALGVVLLAIRRARQARWANFVLGAIASGAVTPQREIGRRDGEVYMALVLVDSRGWIYRRDAKGHKAEPFRSAQRAMSTWDMAARMAQRRDSRRR